jgi:HEAT repeat protein
MLYKGFRITDYMPTALLLVLFKDEDQPDEKRWAACIALGTKHDEPSFAALLEGLHHDDWNIRYLSLEAIKRHALAPRAEPEIVQALFDINDQVRQTACKACADLGFTQAHDAMVQLLAAANHHVRDVALTALSRIWQPEDFERVLHLAETDPERSVRIAAAKVLRAYADTANWRRLFNLWRTDREVRHRMWSCELAGRFGNTAERNAIQALQHDPNRNVRLAADKALRQLAERV